MSSLCISNCRDYASFPIRNTYLNLYKLPESTMELGNAGGGGGGGGACKNHSPRVLVKSTSCRQLYLRSYTFAKKELLAEQTNVVTGSRRRRKMRTKFGAGRKRRWRCRCVMVVRRAKEFSCNVMRAFLHKLLSCAVSVDVVDHKGK